MILPVCNQQQSEITMRSLVIPKVSEHVDITLNIGLDSAYAFDKYKRMNLHKPQTLVDVLDLPYKVATILERVSALAPLNDIRYAVRQSSTDVTLVCRFTAKADVLSAVFELSDVLKQDCIATYIHNSTGTGKGTLIGRHAYVWGKFNVDHFIHID